ncbi:hypothetical protein CH268_00900 [Rhodococcus sp. 06-1460-1B]|nr:hypothetical protein CH268_00900 [Rhodococcus sp. 06-1460-1B]
MAYMPWVSAVMAGLGCIAFIAVVLRMAEVTGKTWADPTNRRLAMIVAGCIFGAIITSGTVYPYAPIPL